MRLAIFADIHANREAFSACLDAARAQGAERIVCLGDVVGYGADPEWAVDTVMALVEAGAMIVRGNHDSAIGTSAESMNAMAQAAVEWTRGRLDERQRRFLSELPFTRARTIASTSIPRRPTRRAGATFMMPLAPDAACRRRTHRSPSAATSTSRRLFDVGDREADELCPRHRRAGALLRGRRWLAVLGSVGQPRDGNPAAAFGMFDTDKREITWCACPMTSPLRPEKIRDNGLPHFLADRLSQGR